MRRSFSTSGAVGALLTAILTLAPAVSRAAESLEQSLEAELEVARGSEIYLVLDIEASKVEIKTHGFALDEVPIHRLGLRTWSPLLAGEQHLAAELPPVLTVTRSATQRREIVIAGQSEATTEEPSAPPPGLETQPATGSYACVLDNGWLLEVRDHEEAGGFWQRLWSQLSAPIAARNAKRSDSPTLVVELATGDAERLRHLFRRDTPVLIR